MSIKFRDFRDFRDFKKFVKFQYHFWKRNNKNLKMFWVRVFFELAHLLNISICI